MRRSHPYREQGRQWEQREQVMAQWSREAGPFPVLLRKLCPEAEEAVGDPKSLHPSPFSFLPSFPSPGILCNGRDEGREGRREGEERMKGEGKERGGRGEEGRRKQTNLSWALCICCWELHIPFTHTHSDPGPRGNLPVGSISKGNLDVRVTGLMGVGPQLAFGSVFSPSLTLPLGSVMRTEGRHKDLAPPA